MFMFHVAFSLSLIALTSGTALYLSAARCDGKGKCFASLIAVLVIIFSALSSLCSLYCGVKNWNQNSGQCQMCSTHDGEASDASTMNGKTKASNKANR